MYLEIFISLSAEALITEKKGNLKQFFCKKWESSDKSFSCGGAPHSDSSFLHEPDSPVSTPDDCTWLCANLKSLLLCSWLAGPCPVEVILLITSQVFHIQAVSILPVRAALWAAVFSHGITGSKQDMLVLERGFGPFILTTSRVKDLKTKHHGNSDVCSGFQTEHSQ